MSYRSKIIAVHDLDIIISLSKCPKSNSLRTTIKKNIQWCGVAVRGGKEEELHSTSDYIEYV